ncbi:MAG: hypothetical protein K6F55_09060 [Eubacterium sp.]|nr:hypothetical protein [Eubacterium sp.]
MKKISLLILTICVMFLFTGCRIYYTYDLSQGENVDLTTEVYYAEDEVSRDKLGPEYESVVLEDGKTYYMSKKTVTESLKEVSKDTDIGVIRPDLIYIPGEKVEEQTSVVKKSTDDIQKLYESMYIKLTFILSEDIVETNGILGEDKRTVTFIRNGGSMTEEMYAYTETSKKVIDSDKTPPLIKGLKKNKYYRNIDSLDITDETGLQSITCNGIDLLCSTVNSDGKVSKRWYLIRQQKFKQGKNVIVATDISGNTSTFTFLYDNKPPVFKKIKNYASRKKKVVFYVKDKDSGIKKLTYSKNNKKMKKIPKKYIKKVKKGKYKGYLKVTIPCKKSFYMAIKALDKAGNSSYVTGIKVN